MNPARRREYLSALQIESWSLRTAGAAREAPRDAAPALEVPAGAVPAPLVQEPGPARAPRLPAGPRHESLARTPPGTARGPSGVGEASIAGEPSAARERSAGREGSAARDGSAAREAGVDWAELQARVAACQRCELCKTRTQTVFGVGNRQAEWLVVGEAPGAEEDRRGEPFVGRAGQLLNSMIRAIGLAREQVYIANVLKCRPPGNRDPSPVEAGECVPYLEQQIALIRPKIMLAVGRIAAQNLLETDSPLSRLRLQVHRFGHSQVPLVVTYHPAYLLRTPGDKRKAWEDLKFAREVCARV